MHSVCLAFAALAVLSGVAAAEPPEPLAPMPPAGTVDARRLAPYDNAFVATQIAADGTNIPVGIWTDELRLRVVDGRTVYQRTQGIAMPGGHFLQMTNNFDPITFAPVSDTQHRSADETWTFDGDHVEGHLKPFEAGAPEKIVKYDTAAPYYDFNCCMRSMFPMLLDFKSLKTGYAITVPVNEGRTEPKNVTFRVVGSERMRAGARGMVDAKIVESPLLDGYVRFWITDKPPFLLHMYVSPNKTAAVAQTFDRIE